MNLFAAVMLCVACLCVGALAGVVAWVRYIRPGAPASSFDVEKPEPSAPTTSAPTGTLKLEPAEVTGDTVDEIVEDARNPGGASSGSVGDALDGFVDGLGSGDRPDV